MICPICKKEQKKSKVYINDRFNETIHSHQFYDEEGSYHNHNNNITTSYYYCSRGHNFVVKTKGSCWCGWSSGEMETIT